MKGNTKQVDLFRLVGLYQQGTERVVAVIHCLTSDRHLKRGGGRKRTRSVLGDRSFAHACTQQAMFVCSSVRPSVRLSIRPSIRSFDAYSFPDQVGVGHALRVDVDEA